MILLIYVKNTFEEITTRLFRNRNVLGKDNH